MREARIPKGVAFPPKWYREMASAATSPTTREIEVLTRLMINLR